MVRLLALASLIVYAARPAIACAPRPRDVEVVANPKATIAPDGGVILTLEEDVRGDGTSPVIRSDGSTGGTRVYLGFGLTLLRPAKLGKRIEVLQRDKVIHRLTVAPSPALDAPRLVRVRSSATRATTPTGSMMYAPVEQMSIEVAGAAPAEAFTLVVFKLEPTGERAVAYGRPDDKHLLSYTTGGKQCGGSFETLFRGEKIAVAWLDIHGRLTKRSATLTVGS